MRPHPRHGTVELQVLDAQAEPAYAISLAALTKCVAGRVHPAPTREPRHAAVHR